MMSEKKMRTVWSLLLGFLITMMIPVFAQEGEEGAAGGMDNLIQADIPVYLSGSCLLTTGERHTGLVLTNTSSGEITVISTERSVGYYASISAGNKYVCYKTFKRLPGAVLQRSVLFDIANGENIPLNDWSPLAGIPCVSGDGKIAYTTGNRLVVVNKDFRVLHDIDLGHHVNLLSFSADCDKIALNDRDEQTVVLILSSGSRRVISAGEGCFFCPQFAPKGDDLLFYDVTGRILLANSEGKSGPTVLGQGSMARWLSNDSIGFVKKTIEKHEVVLTEIVSTGTNVKRSGSIVLNKGDADAVLSEDNIASNIEGILSLGSTTNGRLSKRNLNVPSFQKAVKKDDPETRSLVDKGATREIEGVPVIHQVYDVPNWWWGHWSCGPTAALMCIQYFHKLPKHTFDCTHYSAHKSNYGFYIPEIYSFNGYDYDIGVYVDPAGATAYGGHGWIWQENEKHTSADMTDYINQHGPSSSGDYSPTWDELQQEVMNDHPFVILSSITSGGHYQTVIGYFKNQRTLIVNDPYGDKNIAYPSFQGQRCFYDWPGYSNGYENLNTVSAYIHCRDTNPASPEIYMTDLVADNDSGAPEYTETGTWTTSGNPGYDGGTYRYANAGTIAIAAWTSNILYEGDYEVFAIYRQDTGRATSVRYKVNDSAGEHTVDIDQSGANGMVETLLGTYHFNQGSYSVSVDCQPSTPAGNPVIADAIRFRLIKSIEVDNDDGSPAYAETGTWSTSSNKGHNGKTYRNVGVGAAAKATFTAELQHTGKYEVSVVNRAWNSYVTSAEYEINTPFGTMLVYDDQTQDNLEWKSLGAFSFHEGTNTIAVDAAGSSGGTYVQADAVRFTMTRIAFVADNDDGAPAYAESGGTLWHTSANPGYLGKTYRWADGGASATASWTTSLPVTGEYEVFALIRMGGDRCNNVKYTINTASGAVNLYINQGGSFANISEVSLGTYVFNAGNAAVVLDASTGTPQTTNCVISDSVRFDLITPYTLEDKQFVNSLQNGGFEDDFNHWSKLGPTSYNIMTSGVHGGNKACEFYNTTSYATIWQDPVEVNGETWRTTAWAYRGTGTTNPGFGFKDQGGVTEAGIAVNSTSWDFYSVEWLIADNIDSQAWGTAGSMFLDDVRCGKASRMNWITGWIWNGTHASDLGTDYFAGDGGESSITPNPGSVNGGKTWTTISQPDGFVDLADAIGGAPASCVTYAHVYVIADTPKTGIYLLVGSDDGVKVFLNGAAVLLNDVTRTHDYFSPDMDLIYVPSLSAGENRLMVKVKNGSGPYSFSARFCDDSGDAVFGLTYSLFGGASEIKDWMLFEQ